MNEVVIFGGDDGVQWFELMNDEKQTNKTHVNRCGQNMRSLHRKLPLQRMHAARRKFWQLPSRNELWQLTSPICAATNYKACKLIRICIVIDSNIPAIK